MYTRVGDPFEEWVRLQVEENFEQKKQDKVILMDPAVADAFRASTAISGKFIARSITHLLTSRAQGQEPVPPQGRVQKTSYKSGDLGG